MNMPTTFWGQPRNAIQPQLYQSRLNIFQQSASSPLGEDVIA